MTIKQTEALRLALEAFEQGTYAAEEKAITAIREALDEPAQPCKYPHCDYPCPDLPDCRDAEQPAQQQEPVAWKDEQGNVRMTLDAGEIQSSVGYVYSVHGERIKNACIRSDIPNGTPLYTSPPASKPWVGLTYGEVLEQKKEDPIQFYRAIEAKLREKNA